MNIDDKVRVTSEHSRHDQVGTITQISMVHNKLGTTIVITVKFDSVDTNGYRQCGFDPTMLKVI